MIERLKVSKYSFLSLIITSILILVATFRGNTQDTVTTYYRRFNELETFPYNPFHFYSTDRYEIVSAWIIWLSKSINSSFEFFLALYSLITFFVLWKISKASKTSYLYLVSVYASNFFIVHQLVVMRQGLGSVLFLYFFVLLCQEKRKPIKKFTVAALALFTHFTMIAPLTASIFVNIITSTLKLRSNFHLITISIFVIGFLTSYLLLHLELIYLIGTVRDYAELGEEFFSSTRNILSPVNLRSICILLLGLMMYKFISIRKLLFQNLIYLYAIGVGCRIGFSEFYILSGRIGSAIGFCEILIFVIILSNIRPNLARNVTFIIFIIIQTSITLLIQAPHIITDYGTPILK